MSVSVSCDRCKEPIKDVAYVLMAVDAERLDIHRPVTGPTYLHWECVPLYGRNEPTKEPS